MRFSQYSCLSITKEMVWICLEFLKKTCAWKRSCLKILVQRYAFNLIITNGYRLFKTSLQRVLKQLFSGLTESFSCHKQAAVFQFNKIIIIKPSKSFSFTTFYIKFLIKPYYYRICIKTGHTKVDGSCLEKN